MSNALKFKLKDFKSDFDIIIIQNTFLFNWILLNFILLKDLLTEDLKCRVKQSSEILMTSDISIISKVSFNERKRYEKCN